MHLCLRLPEIVERICESLIDDSREVPFLAGSAASLACSCKSLQEPVLNFLWADQQSLINLLRAFPADSWQCGSDQLYGQASFVFTRTLLPADWERVLFYAGRIRCLTHYQFLDSATYLALQQCPEDGRPLLRQLRAIILYDEALNHLRETLAIVGPNLSHFSVSFGRWGQDGLDGLDVISYKWPKLESLSVHNTVPMPPSIDPIWALLSSQTSLRICTLGSYWHSIDAGALNHLASLPSLREINIKIDSHSLSAVPSVSDPFKNLTQLYLSASSLNNLLSIANLLRQAPLRVLDIHESSATSISAVEFHSFITTLFEGMCRSSLTFLDLHTRDLTIHDPPMIETRTFRTLAAFSQLRTIMIDFALSISLLDDVLLEDMARGWPHAEKIWFCYTRTLTNVAKATFKGLASLVQHCPRLHSLLLSFTATNPNPSLLEHIASNGISNDTIRVFNVNWSAIGDSDSDVQVATKILMALFPRLREMRCHITAPDPFPSELALWESSVQRWTEVARLVSIKADGKQGATMG